MLICEQKATQLPAIPVPEIKTHEWLSGLIKETAAPSPLVLNGAGLNWPAHTLWNPRLDGLRRLRNLVGSVRVEAMSSTTQAFHGALGEHTRISLTMDQLLDEFKEFSSTGENSTSLYLAQAPIQQPENDAESSLAPLLQDIEIPSVLRDYKLTATNLWLSVGRTQSSIHYDPYHNLLCVVAGGKSVTLWSPELMPAMYPKAIYGEASNHSNVNFTSPDFDRHPKFKEALSRDVRHIAELGPGDMLFIPEGWYHQVHLLKAAASLEPCIQVDSTASTIAVNFWWESTFQLGLGGGMDCYYARSALASLLAAHKRRKLEQLSQHAVKSAGSQDSSAGPTEGAPPLESSLRALDEAEKSALQSLGRAVTRAAAAPECPPPRCSAHQDEGRRDALPVGQAASNRGDMQPRPDKCRKRKLEGRQSHQSSEPLQHARTSDRSGSGGEEISPNRSDTGVPSRLVDATAARCVVEDTFASLTPTALQRVLYAMAHTFPRSLERLVLHGLSPAACELLTSKLEEADALRAAQESSEADEHPASRKFYEQFYGVFQDGAEAALRVMVEGKELFAKEAMKEILTDMVGVHGDFDMR
ncbi:hypothetical protein CYMTET_24258 [Cymbomonas tetramitiformis]|uniref:JmjC domain-containing protein n=1 Tax=Cymbomonas tetramitiformis TaxID=36881 RepID=A0AAE0FXK5_9CHLO|nr:hypothetical protein CYMTET_24258 [Cymbomonas tetramitiformis]